MKMFSPLSEMPELRELDDVERSEVIREWLHAADQRWSGYLLHVGFCVVVALFVVIVAKIVFARLFAIHIPDGVDIGFLVFGLILGNIFYARLLLRKRRDLLQRILEERRHAP